MATELDSLDLGDEEKPLRKAESPKVVDESQALAAEMNDEEDRESFWKPVSHSASGEEKEIPALVKRTD